MISNGQPSEPIGGAYRIVIDSGMQSALVVIEDLLVNRFPFLFEIQGEDTQFLSLLPYVRLEHVMAYWLRIV